jgi:hypothetical protein
MPVPVRFGILGERPGGEALLGRFPIGSIWRFTGNGGHRGLGPIGAKIRGVSRAPRSASLRAFTPVFAGYGRVVRCRPGIVTHTAFAKVPDQRCTASLPLALHRIRDTSHLILAPMGPDPRVHRSFAITLRVFAQVFLASGVFGARCFWCPSVFGA